MAQATGIASPSASLAAISVGWKVFVFTLGAALPRWLIDDGDSHLPLATQPYAEEVKVIALGLWSGRIERHGLVRSIRVMSVDGGPTACGGPSARTRAYTCFAIPYSEVRTMCDASVVEYRVFRRRR